MHLDLNPSRIPGYVPALLIVVGFALALTGRTVLQVVGVGLLLIAFAIPIIGTLPLRGRRSDLPPIDGPPRKKFDTFGGEEVDEAQVERLRQAESQRHKWLKQQTNKRQQRQRRRPSSRR
jgi:hypothetical protein